MCSFTYRAEEVLVWGAGTVSMQAQLEPAVEEPINRHRW